jgi:hypothetical protein
MSRGGLPSLLLSLQEGRHPVPPGAVRRRSTEQRAVARVEVHTRPTLVAARVAVGPR